MAKRLSVSGGKVEVVLLQDVGFDESYQRGVKNAHKKYARDFDHAAAGVPTVARRRDGTLWGIDGRQRFTAMLKAGFDRWRCLVVESSGAQYEAQLFKKINKDRTGMNAAELYAAALTAQDPTALATKRAVESAGLVIYPRTGGKHDQSEFGLRVLSCHGTVWGAVSVYGEEKISRALKLLVTTFPACKQALHNNVVGGMCKLIGIQGDLVDDARFVKVVGRKPILKYIQDAALDMGGKTHGVSRSFVQQYNKGLSNKSKLKTRLNEQEVSEPKELLLND